METQLSLWHLILTSIGLAAGIVGVWVNGQKETTRLATKVEYISRDIDTHNSDIKKIHDKINKIFEYISEIKIMIAEKK